MKTEKTSKRVAAIAGKVLETFVDFDVSKNANIFVQTLTGDLWLMPFSFAELKALAASALTQAPDKPKVKK